MALVGLRKIGEKCHCKLLGALGPLLSCARDPALYEDYE